jgi:hypothetical protein
VPESGGSDRDRKQMPPPMEVAPDRVAAHDVFVMPHRMRPLRTT